MRISSVFRILVVSIVATVDGLDVSPAVLLNRAATANVAIARALIDSIPGEIVRLEPQQSIVKPAARVCRRVFEELGPAYIKLGQLIASSPTAFPAEIVEEFSACLDDTPSVNFETQILPVIEASMNKSIREIFWSIDPVPLASASVAQVHAAIIKNQTDNSLIKVAVKIRKPHVLQSLQADLQFVTTAANALESIAPQLSRINLANLITDLNEQILGELDFTQEAQRLESFSKFLHDQNLHTVATVPKPIQATPDVLIMTRLDGYPLANAKPNDPKTKQAVATMLRVWAASVLYHDFFHADVHGSNCFLLHDGRLAFLDFGIVGSLPPSTYDSVLRMADAYNTNDDYRLAKALVDLQVAKNDVDLHAFARDLRRALSGSTQDTQSTTPSSAATVITTIIDLAQTYHLELPREFGLLLKQALYLAGYIDQLAPGLEVFQNPTLALLQEEDETKSPAYKYNSSTMRPLSSSII